MLLHLMLVLSMQLCLQASPPPTLRTYRDLALTEQSNSEVQLTDNSEPPVPSLTLEVPREGPAQVFYYDYPPPSEDLEVPSTQPWNPNNDAKYYFELPAKFTNEATATNLYPKKYNKDLHDKQKPYNNKPKQEIKLIPIPEEDYIIKQRRAQKVALNLANNLAKAENKVQQTI